EGKRARPVAGGNHIELSREHSLQETTDGRIVISNEDALFRFCSWGGCAAHFNDPDSIRPWGRNPLGLVGGPFKHTLGKGLASGPFAVNKSPRMPRLLHIEDDPANRLLVRKLLKPAGFEIV